MNWRRVAFFLAYAVALGAAAYFYRSYSVALWGLLGFVAMAFIMGPLRRLMEAFLPYKPADEMLERFNKLANDMSPILTQNHLGRCQALQTYMEYTGDGLMMSYEANKKVLFPHDLNFDGYLYFMPRFVFDKKGKDVGDLNLHLSQIDVVDTERPDLQKLVYFLFYPVAGTSDITKHYGDVHRYFDGVTCAYTGKKLGVVEVELRPTVQVKYTDGTSKNYNRVLRVILQTHTESKAEMAVIFSTMQALRRDKTSYWSEIANRFDFEDPKQAPTVKVPQAVPNRWFEGHADEGGTLRDGWVYFGDKYAEDGSPYWVPVNKLTHFLVSGTSGSGKSVFLHQFLAGIAHNERHFQDVYLIDLKGGVELWRYEGTANGLFHVVYEYEKVIEMVDGLNDLMDERLNDMRERGLREWDGRKVLVVIDEFASLSYEVPEDKEGKATQQKMFARLSRLSSKSRAAGIILWAQLQKGTTDVMDSSFRNNLQSEVMFKMKNKLQAAQVFGSTDDLKVDPTRLRAGEFVMFDATRGEVVYLKSRQVRGME